MIYRGVIYCAISPSGKKYYGFTYNLDRRKYIHKRDSLIKKNRFYNAIKKYGFDNFIWNIIETYENESKAYIKEILHKREKFWIDKDKTYFSEFGYNMTLGGDGGDTFLNKSYEEKEKIRTKRSESNYGKNNPMYGKRVYNIWLEKYGKEIADKKLEEFKNKNSESHKGKSHPCSEETKEKIGKKLSGYKISEESRIKRIGNKNASGKRSEDTKLKMSISAKGNTNHLGKKHSIETKEKIRKAKTGENNHNYGKHFTKEHKKKMSDSHKKRIELLKIL